MVTDTYLQLSQECPEYLAHSIPSSPLYQPLLPRSLFVFMLVVLQALFTAGGSLAVYGFISFVRLLYREYTSTLRNLPGPPSPSWLFGNFKQIQETVSNTVCVGSRPLSLASLQ